MLVMLNKKGKTTIDSFGAGGRGGGGGGGGPVSAIPTPIVGAKAIEAEAQLLAIKDKKDDDDDDDVPQRRIRLMKKSTPLDNWKVKKMTDINKAKKIRKSSSDRKRWKKLTPAGNKRINLQ